MTTTKGTARERASTTARNQRKPPRIALRDALVDERRKIADARDRMRALLARYNDVLDVADRADDALSEAIDALSERL